MSNGLYRGAISMAGHEKRLTGIATNLANISTVGYKRGSTASHEFEVSRPNGKVRGLALRTRVDFSQGNLERTGRDLDLALFGDGFFAVEGPEGEIYTRDGSFHVTQDGVLITREGYSVSWEKKNSSIDPAGLPVTINGDGVVRQGQDELGRLRLVDFGEKQSLGVDARGFWTAPRGLAETTFQAKVHQGALEESNASGTDEIIALINVQRAFESVANVVSSIDQSYRRLTRPF